MQITLQIHSHRGHYTDYGDYHPSNLLTDSKTYASKSGSTTNDWIIFSYNKIYLPKRVVIKTVDHAQSPKTFRVFIGDGQEWHLFNPTTMDIARNTDDQSFSIDGVDGALIQKKQLRQIKLELIENHGFSGTVYFHFTEFKLFGLAL